MTNNPLVSVLVPVYNMERYLERCLKALADQTLEDLEIVAIDDGSTDSSPQILSEWAQRDPRIRVITKPNSGYGASMNRGLAAASGTYIGIIEPDDYPDLAMFQKLANAAEKHHADVVKCNYYMRYEDHEDILWNLHGIGYNKPFDPVIKPQIVKTTPSIWTAIYRRSFLEREGIDFRETPGAAFQDASFSLKVWFAARCAVLLRRPMLHYSMDNPGSSSKTTDKVYIVCDELACAYDFLKAHPERFDAFVPWFHADKWAKYRWNYERIAPEVHEEFAKRMRTEFAKARDLGELDLGVFEPISRGQVKFLLDEGPEAFATHYPDTFPADYETDLFAVSYGKGVAKSATASAVPAAAAAPASGPVPEGPSPAATIIVPVYNTEPYVRDCIESLKQQTYSDFEVFVIDDASTDKSLVEANAAIDGDERFHLLPQTKNRGLSAVRNIGIEHASGEYLIFLDSDDFLSADAVEQLIRRARTQQLDDLYFSGQSFYETLDVRANLREEFGARTPCDDVLTGRELFVRFQERDEYFPQAALRMIRRGLLEEHGIRFREGILHEDILFTFQTLSVSQRSSFLDEPLYQRRLRGDSIMGKARTLANIDGHFVSLQEIKRWLAANINDVDQPFASAVGKMLALFREVTAHDWTTCISEEDQAKYLAQLSEADRVDFYCDIIGSGAQSDRVRQEYEESKSYRLGRAVAAGPLFVRDMASNIKARRK